MERKGEKMDEDQARSERSYLEKMIRLFVYDSMKLLDLALTDDEEDPQISACVVCDRFETLLVYEALEEGGPARSLREYLLRSGYTEEDIRRLEEKCAAERRRYANLGTLPRPLAQDEKTEEGQNG